MSFGSHSLGLLSASRQNWSPFSVPNLDQSNQSIPNISDLKSQISNLKSQIISRYLQHQHCRHFNFEIRPVDHWFIRLENWPQLRSSIKCDRIPIFIVNRLSWIIPSSFDRLFFSESCWFCSSHFRSSSTWSALLFYYPVTNGLLSFFLSYILSVCLSVCLSVYRCVCLSFFQSSSLSY